MKRILTIATLAACAAGSAHAATFIVQPTNADVSSAFNGNFDPVDAINGVGLTDSTIVETNDPVPASWTGHTDNSVDMWVTANGSISDAWIMFDLGASYSLEGLHNWNFNHETDRGVQDLDIKFATSLTGAFGSTDETDSGWGTATALTFAQAPGGDANANDGFPNYTGETISFTAPVTARYVLFDIKTNYGNSIVGLAETRFLAVPEPSSLALMGLGGLLIARRRRG